VSALSDKALELANLELATGVRGGLFPPYARFRGPRVDEYQLAVGLPLDPDPSKQGYPWCASAVYWLFRRAAAILDVPNPCPRTAGAIHLWDAAQDVAGTHTPLPGCVFVLDRGHGKGHVGFVSYVRGDGLIHSVEPDTSNLAMTATGDAWGEHDWDPRIEERGTLLGYLAF
jgi:hypothetical protein